MSPKRAETDDTVARLAVLGAVVRGMSFAYTARTAAVTIDKVREIAEAAGWPDIDEVRAVHAALRNASEKSKPRRVAPPPRPAPPARTAAAVPDVVIGLPEPAPEPEQPSAIEVDQAEREYRGEVVQTGPTPEHREPLEEYAARVNATMPEILRPGAAWPVRPATWPIGETWPDAPDPSGDLIDVEPLTEEDQTLIEEHDLPPATDNPAPAATKRPTKRPPGTLPCEVCGKGVTVAYIERTGKQRHGHHPADA